MFIFPLIKNKKQNKKIKCGKHNLFFIHWLSILWHHFIFSSRFCVCVCICVTVYACDHIVWKENQFTSLFLSSYKSFSVCLFACFANCTGQDLYKDHLEVIRTEIVTKFWFLMLGESIKGFSVVYIISCSTLLTPFSRLKIFALFLLIVFFFTLLFNLTVFWVFKRIFVHQVGRLHVFSFSSILLNWWTPLVNIQMLQFKSTALCLPWFHSIHCFPFHIIFC